MTDPTPTPDTPAPDLLMRIDLGEPVTLRDCEPGLFMFNGSFGFKTEYAEEIPAGSKQYWPGAYCLDSGEFFWGGVSKHEDRAKLMVRPAALRAERDEAQPVAGVANPDPNCPDCLGEGVNVYSFDPPLAYPCARQDGATLLPCPFCGGKAEFVEGKDNDGRFVAVVCGGCGAGSSQHYPIMDDARPNAACAWNKRAHPPATSPGAAGDAEECAAASTEAEKRYAGVGPASSAAWGAFQAGAKWQRERLTAPAAAEVVRVRALSDELRQTRDALLDVTEGYLGYMAMTGKRWAEAEKSPSIRKAKAILYPPGQKS